MLMRGRELGVLEGSGWQSSLDVANRTICGSPCYTGLASCFPVIDIDAATHDAVLAEKVLQEVLLDGDSSQRGSNISSSVSNRNAIESSS